MRNIYTGLTLYCFLHTNSLSACTLQEYWAAESAVVELVERVSVLLKDTLAGKKDVSVRA